MQEKPKWVDLLSIAERQMHRSFSKTQMEIFFKGIECCVNQILQDIESGESFEELKEGLKNGRYNNVQKS